MQTQTHASDTPPKTLGLRRSDYDPLSHVVVSKHLKHVVGVSTTTAWRLRKRGLFPAPIKVSAGRVCWLRSDLEQWLSERAAR